MTPNGVDENGARRRREDHPDWKMAAPRWLLVLIAAAWTVGAWMSVTRHIAMTKATSEKVDNVVKDVDEVKRTARVFECGLLETRVDVLTYQEYMARRNRDYGFAGDLKERKEAAEELLRHRRQSRECDG